MFEISYRFILILSIIALGYIAKKFKLLKITDGEALARIAFNFTLPSIIISTLENVTLEKSYLIYPLLGILISAIYLVITKFAYKNYDRKSKGMFLMPLLGLNIGLFAVPLVDLLWGSSAVKFLLLMDIGNAFVIFVICYLVGAVYSIDGEKVRVKDILKKSFSSIPLIIYIITIILKLSGVYYPKPIIDLANIIALGNTPIAMITLGIFLSFTFERNMIGKIVKFWIIKYVVGISLGLLAFLFLPINETAKVIVMIAFILPSSFAVIPYAVKFKYDPKFVGILINSTIVISIVIMWIIALVTK